MLFQNDPFRELDAWLNSAGRRQTATSGMAMDAYRRGNDVWVHIDLPGVAADGIEIDLDRNVLTVSAERSSTRTKPRIRSTSSSAPRDASSARCTSATGSTPPASAPTTTTAC